MPHPLPIPTPPLPHPQTLAGARSFRISSAPFQCIPFAVEDSEPCGRWSALFLSCPRMAGQRESGESGVLGVGATLAALLHSDVPLSALPFLPLPFPPTRPRACQAGEHAEAAAGPGLGLGRLPHPRHQQRQPPYPLHSLSSPFHLKKAQSDFQERSLERRRSFPRPITSRPRSASQSTRTPSSSCSNSCQSVGQRRAGGTLFVLSQHDPLASGRHLIKADRHSREVVVGVLPPLNALQWRLGP